MAVKKRIGIFGGTFDPIHLGHLIVAETIMDEFSLDRVVFIPAAVPPHKLGKDISAAHHRYMMTMLAICSNPRFEASDMEMRRTGPSYSRDTLAELIREHGEDTDFYFIVGADSVASLHTWNRIEELLSMCHFVGASRPGCLPDMEEIRRRFGRLAEKIHCPYQGSGINRSFFENIGSFQLPHLGWYLVIFGHYNQAGQASIYLCH